MKFNAKNGSCNRDQSLNSFSIYNCLNSVPKSKTAPKSNWISDWWLSASNWLPFWADRFFRPPSTTLTVNTNILKVGAHMERTVFISNQFKVDCKFIQFTISWVEIENQTSPNFDIIFCANLSKNKNVQDSFKIDF